MNIGENLKRIRKENKLTLEQLAEALNNKSNGEMNFNKGRISKWENGKEEPRLSSVKLIADFYGINIDSLYSSKSSKPSITSIYNQLEQPRQQKVYKYTEQQLEEQNKVTQLEEKRTAAYYGGVAANPAELSYGDPVYDEKVTSDVPVGADGALTIHGDSMEDLFKDGDICFFHRQPDVENGEIAIVEIDGTGVTCKKVIKENGCVILRSLNDKYEDRKIEKESVRIIGKVII